MISQTHQRVMPQNTLVNTTNRTEMDGEKKKKKRT